MKGAQAVQGRWLHWLLSAELGLTDAGEEARLALFQQTGLVAVEAGLARYGGVVLADEVGLGKTHVACAVLQRRRSGLVLAPASLLGMWGRRLEDWGVSERVELVSHTGLALGRLAGARRVGVVVVDEAHAFVHPETHRYQALARLALKAPLVLMTATPFGLDASEMLHMLRLFLPTGSCRGMFGMPLEAWLEQAGEAWSSVLRRVVVRRSRGFLRRHWPDGLVLPDEAGEEVLLTFPQRTSTSVEYSADRVLEGGLRSLVDELEALDEQVIGSPPGLMKSMLLSRLESSPAALGQSLGRLEGYLERRVEAARRGRRLSRRSWQEVFGGLSADLDRQQVFPFVFDAFEADGAEVATVEAQREGVRRLWRRIQPLIASDPKAEALVSHIRGLGDEARVLIFTRFVDTAEDLYRRLGSAFPGWGVGLVCGEGARHTGRVGQRVPRRLVLERFMAGGDERERLRILVATDVLSEGLDLQMSGSVVSYDLPWNPRRLVQRFGRLDRLGPSERTIETVLIRPDRELEVLLGVMRTLHHRMEEAARLIGGLDPWLDEPPETPPGEAWALPRDRRLDAEFMMRSDLLSLTSRRKGGALPCGWGMRAGPRSPAGTLLIYDTTLPGAPLHWVFVPDEGEVVHDRAVLYPRVRGLLRRPSWPLERPPSRAQRLGLMDALAHQERLWGASLQPLVHPPASAVARLLRRLSGSTPPSLREPEGLEAYEQLMAWLAGPLPMGVVALIEEGLTQEVQGVARWLELLSEHMAARPQPQSAPGTVVLLGFVTFEPDHQAA